MLTRRKTYLVAYGSRISAIMPLSLVFVIQQMAMEHRHALADGVSTIQYDLDKTVIRNTHGIQPRRMLERRAVLCVSQKVRLAHVEGMQLASLVDSTPMLIGAHADAGHWTRIGNKLAVIDVEAVLVLRECGSSGNTTV